jgi:predicted GNAT family acetyltransferase
MSVSVRDNPAESRYEVYDGDSLAGFTVYRLRSDQIAFVHTETDPAFAGKGLAKRLVRGALDDVRRRRLHAVPRCPFVRKFISKHPEYVDLVPEDQRGRYDLDASATA